MNSPKSLGALVDEVTVDASSPWPATVQRALRVAAELGRVTVDPTSPLVDIVTQSPGLSAEERRLVIEYFRRLNAEKSP